MADVFSGSIPGIYQSYLVPLIFDTYAADLAVRTRMSTQSVRRYAARAYDGNEWFPVPAEMRAPDGVCVTLPLSLAASPERPSYLVVDLAASIPRDTYPLRAHLYHLGGTSYRIVGLERPYEYTAPDL